MKEKIECDEDKFFENLSISRDIQIKNLSSLISPKDRRPSHYENVFKDIKALFFTKNIEEAVPSPSQGIDSGNEEIDNEYDKNEENYENGKIAIMAKFKSSFGVYRDTFLSHVDKLMKGETRKMQSYRFKVCTRTTSAFFQTKAEEESEIWSNVYGYVDYDAIQMQVSESFSLNGDHIKSIIPPVRRTWTLWGRVFSNELFEEYIKHT